MAEDHHPVVSVEYHERVFAGFLRVCAFVFVMAILILIFLAFVGT